MIQLIALLSLAPSILVMMTSFTRIVVVLSLLRTALGTATAPPNAVIISLALFLTGFVMWPAFQTGYDAGVKPLLANEINVEQAFERASQPFRAFMLKNVRDKDLKLFNDMANEPAPATPEQLSLRILIPAFMISELKRAFEIGFLLFLPFLIIDLVVASALMSMGMMMLPPVVVSLPFKLIFFRAGGRLESGGGLADPELRAELAGAWNRKLPNHRPARHRLRALMRCDRPGRLADRLWQHRLTGGRLARRARGKHRHVRISRLHVADKAVERIDGGYHARHVAELGTVGAKPRHHHFEGALVCAAHLGRILLAQPPHAERVVGECETDSGAQDVGPLALVERLENLPALAMEQFDLLRRLLPALGRPIDVGAKPNRLPGFQVGDHLEREIVPADVGQGPALDQQPLAADFVRQVAAARRAQRRLRLHRLVIEQIDHRKPGRDLGARRALQPVVDLMLQQRRRRIEQVDGHRRSARRRIISSPRRPTGVRSRKS